MSATIAMPARSVWTASDFIARSPNTSTRFVAELLADAELDLGAIDRVIPHQASELGMAHVFRRIAVPRDRIEDIFATHGNQVAASLPTALHHALDSGRLRAGDTALLVGTAAGVTMGGAVLRL